jgi:hypothetical protein
VTCGGAVYVGVAMMVEIDGSNFSEIENVTSGGGLYVANSDAVVVTGCTFSNIAVKLSGGVYKGTLTILYLFDFSFYHVFEGGLWMGGETVFTIAASTFSDLRAGEEGEAVGPPAYGGAIYTQSTSSGLRSFVNLTFLSNAVVGSKGNYFVPFLLLNVKN